MKFENRISAWRARASGIAASVCLAVMLCAAFGGTSVSAAYLFASKSASIEHIRESDEATALRPAGWKARRGLRRAFRAAPRHRLRALPSPAQGLRVAQGRPPRRVIRQARRMAGLPPSARAVGGRLVRRNGTRFWKIIFLVGNRQVPVTVPAR